MTELHRVRYLYCTCGFSHNSVATVVLECHSHIPTLHPSYSAWSYLHGAFNYDATPIVPLGCDIIAHRKKATRNSWDFRGAAGWYVGVALQHYRCHNIVDKSTHAVQISDTVEFRHQHLTQPEVRPMDRIVHGVNTLTCALKYAPQIACDNQLFAIHALQQAVQRWKTTTTDTRTQPCPSLRTICHLYHLR